jgi:hypothetical protein
MLEEETAYNLLHPFFSSSNHPHFHSLCYTSVGVMFAGLAGVWHSLNLQSNNTVEAIKAHTIDTAHNLLLPPLAY